jgi:putative NADH-flavin reductase
LKHVLADHELQESHVKNSSLDWVIVRPGNYIQGTHTGSYRQGFTELDKSVKIKISQADVADFMLRQLADNRYLHATPGISY